MGLPRDNSLICAACSLRKNLTEAEKLLWFRFLRNYPIRFTQQKIIGSYIVDFFCNKVRISIELDGSQHYQEEIRRRDKIRTTYLEMLEIKELRFPNNAIWDNFEGVCESIHQEIQKRRNDVIDIPIHELIRKK